jgi:ABC-2 type transport system permease protein
VFTGRLNGAGVWNALLVQAIWFAVLIVPIAWMWRAARKRLFVQGG